MPGTSAAAAGDPTAPGTYERRSEVQPAARSATPRPSHSGRAREDAASASAGEAASEEAASAGPNGSGRAASLEGQPSMLRESPRSLSPRALRLERGGDGTAGLRRAAVPAPAASWCCCLGAGATPSEMSCLAACVVSGRRSSSPVGSTAVRAVSGALTDRCSRFVPACLASCLDRSPPNVIGPGTSSEDSAGAAARRLLGGRRDWITPSLTSHVPVRSQPGSTARGDGSFGVSASGCGCFAAVRTIRRRRGPDGLAAVTEAFGTVTKEATLEPLRCVLS